MNDEVVHTVESAVTRWREAPQLREEFGAHLLRQDEAARTFLDEFDGEVSAVGVVRAAEARGLEVDCIDLGLILTVLQDRRAESTRKALEARGPHRIQFDPS